MFNPETKRQSAQWKHTDSPPPKKFRVTASAEKKMVAMFWDSEDVILTHCVPKSTTVTDETYEEVFRSFFQHCVKNGPQSLQLCSFITTTLLLIGRLVFTSFSTTTTFKVSLTLRTHLTSHQAIFRCFQIVPLLIFQWSQRTPKEAFAVAMQSWHQHCEKCVRLQGDCVEKWLHFQIPLMSNF